MRPSFFLTLIVVHGNTRPFSFKTMRFAMNGILKIETKMAKKVREYPKLQRASTLVSHYENSKKIKILKL